MTALCRIKFIEIVFRYNERNNSDWEEERIAFEFLKKVVIKA